MEYLHSQVYHFGKLFQSCHAAAKELLGEDGGNGGERGIRTLGTVARTRDFQSRTFGHSVTSPEQN